MPRALPTVSKVNCSVPAAAASICCVVAWYGTCTASMPVRLTISSVTRCPPVPTPAEA
jgi:hypothetical protein